MLRCLKLLLPLLLAVLVVLTAPLLLGIKPLEPQLELLVLLVLQR